ncbi:hypothetical protein JXB22_07760 [candidate division WOR-3 bacterium]|nr:hypothetical protein [candidate division WOR-3 bacterium]
MKRTIPLVLVTIFGIFGIIPFIVPHPIVQNTDSFLRNELLKILMAFALILGLGSLLNVHMNKIQRKRKNWQYSLALIITFAITSIIGLFGGVNADGILPTRIGSFAFDIWTIYLNVEVPLGATMFAMLAFFMASASYRAFRARSPEATLLLSAAFIVMIGVLPLGNSISPHLPSFAQWIMDVPNVAGQRGIMLGVALGILATGLKILLGIERSWLGGD